MQNAIIYQIQATYPERHVFEVACTILNPDPNGQRILLPAWIPGSYLVRDFSKHVITLQAESQGKAVPVQMLDKTTWQCAPVLGPLTVHYQIYAYDWVPRGAHVDNTHAFFNGSRVFVQVLGQEATPCLLHILPPKEKSYQKWRVGTAMPRHQAEPYGFGQYRAANYDELIDHPVEMGEFEVAQFDVGNIPHELIITGRHKGDIARLCRDIAQICQYHINLFGSPIPIERYVFLLTVFAEGYGGLEHRASTSVHCRRDTLPKIGITEVTEGYQSLLGLLSHEYFHTWNVKRIKPKAFVPMDFTKENYTRDLWIFEGITSYYDDLALVRTGLITKEKYLILLGQNISRILATPGRFKQTLAQSSFEAWTKYYKPDENTPNATISYYFKGALVALALDLHLRHTTNNRIALEDILRACWVKYGSKNEPLAEGEFEKLAESVSGCALGPFFDVALRSTEEIALEALFASHGIHYRRYPALSMEDLGGKIPNEPIEILQTRPLLELKLKPGINEAQITTVFAGGSVETAGLAAGDIIIAVNGLKAERANLETMIAEYAVGDRVDIHVFRRDELMTFQVTLAARTLQNGVLTLMESQNTVEAGNLKAWLEPNQV